MRWKVVTVEEGLGGADEEWDGNARQVGTEGLATTGDIVREIENGPGLTGRMENEIMPVLFGRTEVMQTDDRGEMGYPGIGAGHWRDQRGCWRSHVYPYPSYLPYSYTLPAYLNGPVTGILTGPGEKSGAEHVMCIAKNRRLQNGNESNERIIRGNLPLADEYPRKTAHSLERRGHVLCRSSRAIPCIHVRSIGLVWHLPMSIRRQIKYIRFLRLSGNLRLDCGVQILPIAFFLRVISGLCSVQLLSLSLHCSPRPAVVKRLASFLFSGSASIFLLLLFPSFPLSF